MSKKETALEDTGRRKRKYSSLQLEWMESTLDNDDKHLDSKNYLSKNGSNVAAGTALSEQLLFMVKFSRNGSDMMDCVATQPTSVYCIPLPAHSSLSSFCGALGMEPRTLSMVAMLSAAEQHAQSTLLPAVKKARPGTHRTHLGAHVCPGQ